MFLKARDVSKSVLTTSTIIARKEPNREWITLVNNGSNDVHIGLGYAPTTTTGLLITQHGSLTLNMQDQPWFGDIFGIATTAAVTVTGTEVYRYD